MTPLIPYQYLNEKCFLSLNEDDKKYDMALEMAQDDLSDLIGEPFYTEMVNQYVEDTFTANNEEFYEYVKKYLAWQTCFNYLKFSNFNATPTGLREFTDDNSTVLSDVKMYSAERNIATFVNRHKGRLVSFLNTAKETDSSKYPLYTVSCKTEFNFGVTSVSGEDYTMFKVNKNIITNE